MNINPHRSKALANATAAVLLSAALLLFIAPRATAQRPAPPDALERLNESVDALMTKVWPSVVQILVTSYGPREDSNRGNANAVLGRQHAVGSGFVIDPEGYIMTNAHVVSGAQRIQVVLPPPDANGTLASALSTRTNIVPARIVGVASEIDLALLKIDGVKVPALTAGHVYKSEARGNSLCFWESRRAKKHGHARAGVGRSPTD